MPPKLKERTMRVTRNNWWTYLTQPIVGFDEEGVGAGAGAGASSEGAGAGEGTGGEGAGEGQGGEGTGSEGQGAGEDTAGLKSALQKERQEKKALDKELKALRAEKQKIADAELSEVERLKKENEATSTKAAKLAEGFRKNAVHQAVLAAASKAKFRDPSDALRPEVLAIIGVEQDEDDPTQVTIDEKTVAEAIKSLAKSKPHYLANDKPAEQQRQQQKSGSSFGGGVQTQSNLTADEQALAKRYPALAHRIR